MPALPDFYDFSLSFSFYIRPSFFRLHSPPPPSFSFPCLPLLEGDFLPPPSMPVPFHHRFRAHFIYSFHTFSFTPPSPGDRQTAGMPLPPPFPPFRHYIILPFLPMPFFFPSITYFHLYFHRDIFCLLPSASETTDISS